MRTHVLGLSLIGDKDRSGVQAQRLRFGGRQPPASHRTKSAAPGGADTPYPFARNISAELCTTQGQRPHRLPVLT